MAAYKLSEPRGARHGDADAASTRREPAAVRRLLWISGTLQQVGGGERLLLEGVRFFAARGIDAGIVTWDFHPRALFDGKYSAENITQLEEPRWLRGSGGVIARAARRAATMLALRRLLRRFRPDVVLCQSEYDCALFYVTTLGVDIPCGVEVFGQMFQFPDDLSKYTLPFRRHLRRIRDSVKGYRETVSLTAPRVGLATRVVAEVLAWLRYAAVRRAARIFVLSRQVAWEVGLLYRRPAVVLKGAFPEALLDYRPRRDVRRELGVDGKQIVLSVSRLIPKKRVAVGIRAFAQIAPTHPDSVYLVGGTGPEEGALRTLSRDLGIADRVRFVGYIPERDLPDYLGTADLFVSLDIADFDIAPYEALALGTSVIWSTEMDLEYPLAGYPFLFPVDPEPGSVAEAMRKALDQPRPSACLRERLRRYSWESYFTQTLEQLEQAVAERRVS